LGGAFGAAFSASPRLLRRGSAAKLFNLFLFALRANSKAIILIPKKQDFSKSDLENFSISAIIKMESAVNRMRYLIQFNLYSQMGNVCLAVFCEYG